MSFEEAKENKKYKLNIVLFFKGKYWSIRQPDSGLVVPDETNGLVVSLNLNPTKVDLKKVSNVIAAYSFRLLDKVRGGTRQVSTLLKDNESNLIDEEVTAYIGRSDAGLDFADYLKLPTIRVDAVMDADGAYNFTARDSIDKMNRPIFNKKVRLTADVFPATVAFQVGDTSEFQAAGLFKINKELISYTGKTATQLTGLTRGEFGTPPASHDLGDEIFETIRIVDNPMNILLKVLISNGGGGVYDTLYDGVGLLENLIDVAEIENQRDTTFAGRSYEMFLYDIDSALKELENEIMLSSGARLIIGETQKVSIAIMDQASFSESIENVVDDTSIANAKWSVNKKDMLTRIEIQYDFNESTGKYEQELAFTNDETETKYGSLKTLKLKFKSIRQALGGGLIVSEMGQRFKARFATPNPEITLTTHANNCLLNVADQVFVNSAHIPSAAGSLNFADSMEVIEKGIVRGTGDVKLRLQFTSFKGLRGAYISPCTSIVAKASQKLFTLVVGRGDAYEEGWKIRLFNKLTYSYEPDPINTIIGIVGDIIQVENDFITVIDPAKHVIRFANYDEVVENQRRFAFVGMVLGGDFSDGSAPYKIGL